VSTEMIEIFVVMYVSGAILFGFLFANAFDDFGTAFLSAFFWPVTVTIIFGLILRTPLCKAGRYLVRLFQSRSKQTKFSEQVDPRRVRLENLLVELEKLTAEIIGIREEFEKETPLYRDNVPVGREVKS